MRAGPAAAPGQPGLSRHQRDPSGGPAAGPRCGFPGAGEGRLGSQAGFPVFPPQPTGSPTVTLGARGEGASRATGAEAALPPGGKGGGGGTAGRHRGWGRRRVRNIPAVLGRAGGCPPRPGPARLGRGRGRELRGVLRASPLWTKSKRPEGRRLLRVGASIYLFIVPDGRSHFSEGILHPPPSIDKSPLSEDFAYPSLFIFAPSFLVFTGVENGLYIFVAPKRSGIDLSRTFDRRRSRRPPRGGGGSRLAGEPPGPGGAGSRGRHCGGDGEEPLGGPAGGPARA